MKITDVKLYKDPQTDVYVAAWHPTDGIYSQGRTKEETKAALTSAVNLALNYCLDNVVEGK